MSDIDDDTNDNGDGTSPPRRVLTINRDKRQSGPAVEERLHKVLANAGLGSRRSLEERIEAGEVRVNAQVAEIGSSVRAGDRVELDGRAFIAVPTEPEEAQVLIYHKPDGEVTTHDDPEGRPTVFEKLPHLKGARWVSIGRLDINTTGLLLVTTDGELANAMMHPSFEVEREYVCRVQGTPDEELLERLRQGVELEDGLAKFDELAVINIGDSHSWFRVVLREGRNREVRRLWESQGLNVSRLKRIRYGSVELPRNLRRGHWESLALEEYRELRGQVGLAEVAQTLTLQAVIGVRRASAPPRNEFKPATRAQGGWSAAGADEARELRAFDFVREDNPRGARPGNKKRRPAAGAKKRGPGGGAGNRPSRGNGQHGNPAAMRTFSPGQGAEEGRGGRGPRGAGRGGPNAGGRGAPGGGRGGPNAGRGGPNAGGRGGPNAGARGGPGGGRGPGGPGGGGRGPGGPGAGRGGPGGPGGRGGRPGAGGGYSPGNQNPGNDFGARRQGGKRGPGGGHSPAMPYGFPSDHAYARRFEADGNTAGPSRGDKPGGGGRRNGPGNRGRNNNRPRGGQ